MRRTNIKLWKGFDYLSQKESFFEVIPCGFPTDDEEIECLTNLLYQTNESMKNKDIPQCPTSARMKKEIDGNVYLIVNNGFHKFSLTNKTMINTLSVDNELIHTSNDIDKAWLIDNFSIDNE
ncbi:MAG: hypothetical protein FWG98_03165 [Candidatus Cloacimonetes bacterium]|nr:hypothetical protein [Candidatus Cloacimonadota bacterium]